MLSLDSRHGYFFWPELSLPSAKTAPGLKPWSRGKRLSGYTEKRGFLTNGNEDAAFLGFKWVEKWRERKGYRLVDIDIVHDLLFVVDAPALHLDGLAPAQVAIPVEAIHSKSEPGRFSKGYGYDPDKVLKALATHDPDIRIREISSYRCVFTAESPLLPAVWADLGFHAISNKPEPTLNILGYGVPAHGIPVPFFHSEDAAKFGLGRIRAIGISSIGLLCESFMVSDPSLAAKVLPILGKVKAGTIVRSRERLQLGLAREHFFFGIRPDACGAILSVHLDAAGLDYVEEYDGLVLLPFRG